MQAIEHMLLAAPAAAALKAQSRQSCIVAAGLLVRACLALEGEGDVVGLLMQAQDPVAQEQAAKTVSRGGMLMQHGQQPVLGQVRHTLRAHSLVAGAVTGLHA